MTTATGELLARLEPHTDPERARRERAYLKSDREFLGVGVPATRKVVRRLAAELELDGHDDVLAVALEWWDGPFFECRRAAVELLAARVRLLDEDDLPLVERLVRVGETWAIVDPLAYDVVGRILLRGGTAGVTAGEGGLLDLWSVDRDSFWVRRLSLLSLLPGLKDRDAGDVPPEWGRFCRYADGMLDEQEFFVRKAIGWVLRDVSRRRPELVRAWVEPRLDRMSGVTRREAVKYL